MKDLRERVYEIAQEADYPIESPMDLVPHLPDGLSTTIEVDGEEVSAVEVGKKISHGFPFENPDDLVNTVVESLKEKE